MNITVWPVPEKAPRLLTLKNSLAGQHRAESDVTDNLLAPHIGGRGGKEIMRKLIPTDKPLTRLAVLKEINKRIFLDCKDAERHYREFENYMRLRRSDCDWTDPIDITDKDFNDFYLTGRPDVQEWLVQQGFAKWEEDEIRYSTDGRPGTVKVALREENGYVVIYAPDYLTRSPNIADLEPGGTLGLRIGVNSKIAKKDGLGRIRVE